MLGYQKNMTRLVVGKRLDEVPGLLSGRALQYRVVRMDGAWLDVSPIAESYEMRLEVTSGIVTSAYFSGAAVTGN